MNSSELFEQPAPDQFLSPRISRNVWLASALFLAANGLAADGAPTITTQPQSQIALQGDPVTFAVSVAGTPPFSYQWLRSGTPIPAANGSAYSIPVTTARDNGVAFSVIVSNTLGSVISSNAILRLDPGILSTQIVSLVNLGTHVWRYNASGSDLGTAWREPGFNDGPWPTGMALFGTETTPSVYPEPFRTSVPSPSGGGPITTYFRTRFSFNTSGRIVSISLTSSNLIDDGVVYYLNGAEAGRLRVGAGQNYLVTAANQPSEGTYEIVELPSTNLVAGDNVLAAELHQQATSSSDAVFGMSLTALLVVRSPDTNPPLVALVQPAPNSTVNRLTFVNVMFDEAVTNVGASDLLINHVPTTDLLEISPREYQFAFPQPPTGMVTVAWAPGHGITDTAVTPNSFGGGTWQYNLDTNLMRSPLRISEFMADNAHGIRDEDGTRADWIEIYNPGPLDANLDGWFLTDTATNLTKWRFPSVNLRVNRYLMVWASEKDRRNPVAPLHTNFRLEKNGEYLALVSPDTNVVSEFAPLFPRQFEDISYGRDAVEPDLLGYFVVATPGAQNNASGAGFAPEPVFSLESGVYTNDSLTLTISAPAGTTIRYTQDGSVPTASSATYVSPLNLTSSQFIKARVFQTGLLPSAVRGRNFILLDRSAWDFNSNLPLIIMDTGGRAVPQNLPPGADRPPGSFVLIDTVHGRSSLLGQPQYQGWAGFEIFGQTSAGFPKKPYNVELNDELGNDLSASLLGMPADADWKLRNPYTDKCLMNDFLAFELHEAMGHYAVRRRFVEAFVDTGGGKLRYPQDYHGVLLLLERVERDNDRVDIAELTPAHTNEPVISGGYIFKKDKDSEGDRNFSTLGGAGFSAQLLKIHEPRPFEVTDLQLNWLQNHLIQMERSLYAANWLTATGTNHYSYYLDPDSFVDNHWMVEFTKQIDGYRLSNYFTKDRNGRVKMEPIWDWNLSFGNANYADGGHTNGWYYAITSENGHIWLRRLMNGTTSGTGTSGDPDFNQKIADRWSVLRTNVLNGTNVLGRIDQTAALLSEAAVRDFARFQRLGTYIWPNPDGGFNGDPTPARAWDVDYQNPTNYPDIIEQMKKWTLGRYLWIDSQFTSPPTFNHPGGRLTNDFLLTIEAPAGATTYYTLDGRDPRAPGGAVAAGALVYSGPITVSTNVRVVARARAADAWNDTWSGPAAITLFAAVPSLRITEIMYHPEAPASGDTNADESFEFLELKNIGPVAVNLAGVEISGGIQFVFPSVLLPAGHSVVVVNDMIAFQSRYGTGIQIAGTYTGNLNNAGEDLVLKGALGEPILDFDYEDDWQPATDGFGFSLVILDDEGPSDTWDSKTSWRPSASRGGSPGEDDPAPPLLPSVLVNELLSHSDTNVAPGITDTVELYNPTAAEVDISGWFLTDDFNTPMKFIIPPNTRIGAGDYLLFTEAHFNAGPRAFAFSASGDEAYLFSGDGANLTGYAHGFSFGAQAHGVTFGRHVVPSTGREHFVTQRASTLGGPNAEPLVGPVVVSEIMYHPPDFRMNNAVYRNNDDEFLELQNLTDEPVALYDLNAATNTWRLDDAVDFAFPEGVVLPPRGSLVVVGFDPDLDPAGTAAFRARNLVPNDMPLYGPWNGNLDNRSDSVELRRPDAQRTNAPPAYILVERVDYSDEAPWPAAADGYGLSLQRIVPANYGNDPANWAAGTPTPGGDYVGGTAPTLTSQPTDRTLVAGSNVVFTAIATGSEPLRYQWRFNGVNLSEATNSMLVLNNIALNQAGTYSVLVYNNAGLAVGADFVVAVRVGLRITQQPQDAYVLTGRTTNFTVSAAGSGPVRYQWQRNGEDLPDGTNDTYTIASVQTALTGTYRVRVSDDHESMLSDPAELVIMVRPTLGIRPISQTAVEGGAVSFSASATGTLPMGWRWRNSSGTISDLPNGLFIHGVTNSVLLITNLTLSDAGNYTVLASNVAGLSISSPIAVLTVLADTDHDGLPDPWENSHPGFNSADPADALRDDDGDKMSNADEYFAGTDYLDPSSYLKLELKQPEMTLRFLAVSNRTYTVQATERLNAPWTKIGHVMARTNTRPESVEANGGTNGFFRLVTPAQP